MKTKILIQLKRSDSCTIAITYCENGQCMWRVNTNLDLMLVMKSQLKNILMGILVFAIGIIIIDFFSS